MYLAQSEIVQLFMNKKKYYKKENGIETRSYTSQRRESNLNRDAFLSFFCVPLKQQECNLFSGKQSCPLDKVNFILRF